MLDNEFVSKMAKVIVDIAAQTEAINSGVKTLVEMQAKLEERVRVLEEKASK